MGEALMWWQAILLVLTGAVVALLGVGLSLRASILPAAAPSLLDQLRPNKKGRVVWLSDAERAQAEAAEAETFPEPDFPAPSNPYEP